MRSVFLFLFLFMMNLSNAQVVFDKVYGCPPNQFFGQSIELANTGGYMINSFSGTGYNNTVLCRINSSGDTLWTTRFGTDSIQFKTFDMVRCMDGGYLLCGDYQEVFTPLSMDSYLMKIDSLGNSTWFNKYGITNAMGGGKDYAAGIVQLENGNLATSGNAKHWFTDSSGIQSTSAFQCYVSLFDSVGDSIRTRSIVYCLQADTTPWQNFNYYISGDIASIGSRILIAGRRCIPSGSCSGFAVLFNDQLDTLKSIIFPFGTEAISVAVTSDSAFLVFGKGVLAKVDTLGNLLWSQAISLNQNKCTKVGARSNGEIVALESVDGWDVAFDVTGNSCLSVYSLLHTYDATGNEICVDTIFSSADGNRGLIDFVLEGDSLITFTGGNWATRMTILQYSGRCHETTKVATSSALSASHLFPNPCSDVLTIENINGFSTFVILNTTGQRVSELTISNNGSARIYTGTLMPGLYLLRMIDESGVESTTTFIKE